MPAEEGAEAAGEAAEAMAEEVKAEVEEEGVEVEGEEAAAGVAGAEDSIRDEISARICRISRLGRKRNAESCARYLVSKR